MQQVAIHTPQNVEIGFPTADLGKRIIAKGIDYVLIFILFWLILRIYEGVVGPLYFFRDGWSNRAIFILLFIPVYTYSFWFEILLRGRTPGKVAMKLQVMRLDGLPYSWENALVRWMFSIIDWFPTMGITGFIAISTTKNSQRLGDLAAGTVLITRKKDIGIDQTILLELSSDYQPVYNQVVRLSDNDMRIIKDSFETALKNKDYETIRKLRKKVESVIQASDQNSNDVNFIQTVMRDFNFYTNR